MHNDKFVYKLTTHSAIPAEISNKLKSNSIASVGTKTKPKCQTSSNNQQMHLSYSNQNLAQSYSSANGKQTIHQQQPQTHVTQNSGYHAVSANSGIPSTKIASSGKPVPHVMNAPKTSPTIYPSTYRIREERPQAIIPSRREAPHHSPNEPRPVLASTAKKIDTAHPENNRYIGISSSHCPYIGQSNQVNVSRGLIVSPKVPKTGHEAVKSVIDAHIKAAHSTNFNDFDSDNEGVFDSEYSDETNNSQYSPKKNVHGKKTVKPMMKSSMTTSPLLKDMSHHKDAARPPKRFDSREFAKFERSAQQNNVENSKSGQSYAREPITMNSAPKIQSSVKTTVTHLPDSNISMTDSKYSKVSNTITPSSTLKSDPIISKTASSSNAISSSISKTSNGNPYTAKNADQLQFTKWNTATSYSAVLKQDISGDQVVNQNVNLSSASSSNVHPPNTANQGTNAQYSAMKKFEASSDTYSSSDPSSSMITSPSSPNGSALPTGQRIPYGTSAPSSMSSPLNASVRYGNSYPMSPNQSPSRTSNQYGFSMGQSPKIASEPQQLTSKSSSKRWPGYNSDQPPTIDQIQYKSEGSLSKKYPYARSFSPRSKLSGLGATMIPQESKINAPVKGIDPKEADALDKSIRKIGLRSTQSSSVITEVRLVPASQCLHRKRSEYLDQWYDGDYCYENVDRFFRSVLNPNMDRVSIMPGEQGKLHQMYGDRDVNSRLVRQVSTVVGSSVVS